MRRALTLTVCATLVASAAHGQEGTQCSFEANHPVVVIGQQNTFTGGGVVVRCPAKRITLRADSLEYYGAERRIFLLGNVDYDEPRLKLKSDQLTYFVPEERVLAVGRVTATLPSGSRLVGPQAEYRRAAPGVRTVSEMTAIGRPSVRLVEGRPARRDTTGARRDSVAARRDTTPTVVTANTLFVRGDSLIYGSGQVDIRRPDLTANSDSVFLDTGREFMQLLRSPRIVGTRDRPYRLSGQVIDVHSRNRQLERVVAKGTGSAVSEDMTLTADTIELRVASDLLQHAVAWGPTGARAVSPTQTITADSITAAMPNQRVQTVTASRRAFAEAQPDTVRVRTTEKDWLRGDTIVARFDTSASAPKGTTRQPEIRQLVARGNAQSLYHLPPADSAARAAAINYVTGDVITIAFDSQRVARVVVAGQRAGVYLEPADTATAPRPGGQGATPAPAPAAPRPRTPTPTPRRPVSSRGLEPQGATRRAQ
jgi:lipopolysaccharide export system protein LptA